jgi:2-polyprenyl-3-methyl-5-hydroxy-6-metoxy-1,4-benzoquinol methylase
LRRLDPELEVYPVQRAAGSSTVVALKPPAQRHRRDYRASMLPPLLDRHADIMGLVALRVCAWRSVGFYPNHAPRLWEYPFVAETLSRTLDPGSRIVDVGAGVTPLVPYLADLGYLLDTVDPSSIVRRWPPKPRWSEWGYLDYAAQGLARASWNCTLDRLPDEVSFDGAYSVSVIEHIPADARRAMLASLSDRLRPGAPLILTVDLKRGTDRLLNRCLGEVVEARERHGVFSDLTAEISEAGFHLLLADAVRGWGDVRVDIGYVVAERNASERV